MTIALSSPTNGKAPAPSRGDGQAEPQTAPELPFDPEAHPDPVLEATEEACRNTRARRLEQRRATTLAELSAKAEDLKALGFPLARIKAYLDGREDGISGPAGTKPKGVDGRHNPKAVFWNPNDHSQRWTKKGNQPHWFRDCLAAGLTEQDMLIPEGFGDKE